MLKLGRVLSTFILGVIIFVTCAWAQSALTQIQDTIQNADGSQFNGTLVITWNGSTSGVTVSPLSTTTRIYNGALSVVLIPTTTAATGTYYQAVYNSNDGTVTWTETWQVPPSATALTVSQVRQSTTQGGGSGNGGGTGGSGGNGGSQYATLPISLSQVTGLSSDLDTINSSLTSLTTSVNNLTALVNATGSLAALTTTVNGLTTTVGTLGSTVTSLSSSVTGLNSTVNGLTTTVTGNSASLSSLTGTVNGLSTTATGNTNAIAGLTTTVNGLSTSVTGNTNSLASLNSTVSALGTTVNGYSGAIAGVTSTVNGLSSTVASNSASLANQIAVVNSLGTSVTANSSSIAGLTTTVTTNSNSLAGLTTTVNGLSTSVAANGNSIATLTANVSSLSSTLNTLSNTVAGLVTTVNSLSAGGTNVAFVDAASPTGTMDGANAAFTLANAPAPTASLQLYLNGVMQTNGVDFTLAGSTITFQADDIPQPGDAIQAYYRIPGTGQTATFADNEVPGGTIDGANLTFTLAAAPNPSLSLRFYKNGLLLQQNSDYTLNGATVTFASTAVTPQPGDSIMASYRH